MGAGGVLCVVVNFLAVLTIINSQLYESCQTPKNQQGECKVINKCGSLYAILKKRPISTANADYLRRSQCGFEGTLPKVCCPQDDSGDGGEYDDRTSRPVPTSRPVTTPTPVGPVNPDTEKPPCRTSKNEQGECILLNKCSPMVYILKKRPISNENMNYLKKSQCGIVGNMPKVCCALNNNGEEHEDYDDEEQDSSEETDYASCQTPRNQEGRCLTIQNCKSLYHTYRHRPISNSDVDYLIRSYCGFGESSLKLCCPLNEIDGTNEIGSN